MKEFLISFRKPWLYPDWIFFNLTSTGRKFRRESDYVHSVSEDIIHKRREALVCGFSFYWFIEKMKDLC